MKFVTITARQVDNSIECQICTEEENKIFTRTNMNIGENRIISEKEDYGVKYTHILRVL